MKNLSKVNSEVSLFRPLLDVKKIFDKNFKNIFGTYFQDPSNKSKNILELK